jgi:outer membrane biogenesis lipoprotein LolB
MKLALIACAAALLAAGCVTPSGSALKVTDRAERDRITSQRNYDAYGRAEQPSQPVDSSRNPADSGN